MQVSTGYDYSYQTVHLFHINVHMKATLDKPTVYELSSTQWNVNRGIFIKKNHFDLNIWKRKGFQLIFSFQDHYIFIFGEEAIDDLYLDRSAAFAQICIFSNENDTLNICSLHFQFKCIPWDSYHASLFHWKTYKLVSVFSSNKKHFHHLTRMIIF